MQLQKTQCTLVGTQDTFDGEVMLFMSAESSCNETGASVLIQFVDCSLEVEIIEIGDCDNVGTPLDGSDDTYDVVFISSGENVGNDSMFILSVNTYLDTLPYFIEHTLTLPVDGIEKTMFFVDLNNSFCYAEVEVNQEICTEECSLLIDDLNIFDCDDNGTPQDSTDDVYQIDFIALASNPSIDSTFTTLYNGQVAGPFSFGDMTSLMLLADSEVDSILIVDSNIDTCEVWIVVNQDNCSSDLPCSISIDGLTILDCGDSGTPQDSTDDVYQIEFIALASNPGIDNTFTTLNNGQIAGPFSYGDIASLTLSADSVLDSILVIDSDIDTCDVWLVVNQENCYSDQLCSLSIDSLMVSDCDDNGTPMDSTDDLYVIDLFVASDTGYYLIQYSGIFGPFDPNIESSITLYADNVPDTLIFVSVDDDDCMVQEIVNHSNCSVETIVIDSSQIIIPNVFSPNGDKINDEWFATVLGENITVLDCSIYDRWGSKVFYTAAAKPIWNGQYKNRPVNEGVFVYVLTYMDGNGVVRKIVGDVTVIY